MRVFSVYMDIRKLSGPALSPPLNQVLYKPSEMSWQGQDLWCSIQEYNTGKNKLKSEEKDSLALLYP